MIRLGPLPHLATLVMAVALGLALSAPVLGQTPEAAVRICTENPARSIGASGFGTICVGANAPLTRWGKDFAWKGILG